MTIHYTNRHTRQPRMCDMAEIAENYMIGLGVTVMQNSGLQIDGFFLVVELPQGGSAANEATPSCY